MEYRAAICDVRCYQKDKKWMEKAWQSFSDWREKRSTKLKVVTQILRCLLSSDDENVHGGHFPTASLQKVKDSESTGSDVDGSQDEEPKEKGREEYRLSFPKDIVEPNVPTPVPEECRSKVILPISSPGIRGEFHDATLGTLLRSNLSPFSQATLLAVIRLRLLLLGIP